MLPAVLPEEIRKCDNDINRGIVHLSSNGCGCGRKFNVWHTNVIRNASLT